MRGSQRPRICRARATSSSSLPKRPGYTDRQWLAASFLLCRDLLVRAARLRPGHRGDVRQGQHLVAGLWLAARLPAAADPAGLSHLARITRPRGWLRARLGHCAKIAITQFWYANDDPGPLCRLGTLAGNRPAAGAGTATSAGTAPRGSAPLRRLSRNPRDSYPHRSCDCCSSGWAAQEALIGRVLIDVGSWIPW
jgi:hypothetical protein